MILGARQRILLHGRKRGLEIAEVCGAREGDEVIVAVLGFVGTDTRACQLGNTLHQRHGSRRELVVSGVDLGKVGRMNARIVPNRVAVENAVRVIDRPCVELRSGSSRIGDAVNALTVGRAKARRGRLRGDRSKCLDDLVALKLLAPIRQERLGLTEDIGRILLLVGVGRGNRMTRPINPGTHAVVVDRLFVAGQGAGRFRRALERGHNRNVDLLAALLVVVDGADDRVHARTHVGREHVFANELLDQFLAVLNKLVVG